MPGTDRPVRGGAVVRAVHFGLERLSEPTEIVVNLNADISFEPDYFARLLGAFAADPQAGHGERQLLRGGRRRVATAPRHRDDRLGRRPCLPPRVPRRRPAARGAHGLGRHRRDEGSRGRLAHDDAHRPAVPVITARRASATAAAAVPAPLRAEPLITSATAPGTCVLRSLHHAIREPSALFMIWGYTSALVRREPQIADRGRARRSCANARACDASRCVPARPSAVADLSARLTLRTPVRGSVPGAVDRS